MASGIYEIVNLVTGRRYIGSAVNIKNRFSTHKNGLRNNKHHCKNLQYSWNKHGEDNFEFNILFECYKSQCIFYEQLWIDFEGYENLYNVSPTAGNSLGMKFSNESKRRCQIAQGGYSVIQIDICGNILGRFESVNEAAKQTGINSGSITGSVKKCQKCCNTMFVKSEENIEFVLQKNREICENQRIARTKSRSKPIYQIDSKTKGIVKLWNSIMDVERELKIANASISRCARGKQIVAGGYMWKYAD